MFVVILGIDGSGKSSVIRHLRRVGYLAYQWKDLRKIPGMEYIAPVQPTSVRSTLSPVLRAAYVGGYLVAEYAHLIRPHMINGDSLVVDSYYFKSLAKEQLYGRSDALLSEVCQALPTPDAIIYLKIEPQKVLGRKKGFSSYEYLSVPTQEDFIDFQTSLDRTMRELVYEIPTFFVDANQPPKIVSNSVVSRLSEMQIRPDLLQISKVEVVP